MGICMRYTEISTVFVGSKACRPFLLEVMVFSPESGYKFEISLEYQCAALK